MDTVVVDLGCAPHNGDDSVHRLINRHDPVALFGFDPLLKEDTTYQIGQTVVHLTKAAAWIGNGELELGIGAFLEGRERHYLDATVIRDKNHLGEWRKVVKVPHFDFCDFIEDISSPDEALIVKMNIEGAEYGLLEHIRYRDLDTKISLLYVAWHENVMSGDYGKRREALERDLRCPIEPWYLW